MSEEIKNKPNQEGKKPQNGGPQKGGYKPKFNFYWIYLVIGRDPRRLGGSASVAADL